MVLIFCVRQLGEEPAREECNVVPLLAGMTWPLSRLERRTSPFAWGASLLMAVGHLSRSFVHIRLCRAGAAAPSVGTSLGTGRGTEQGDEWDGAGSGSAGDRHVA